jgi:NADH dehydrogenase
MEAASRLSAAAQSEWALRGIALVRVAVGLYFLNEAIRKVMQGWLTGGSGFAHSVNGYPSAHSGGIYHQFVTGVILPHASLFAVLVTLGEWSVAVSLTLGLLTRAGALVALWLNLNFMLLRGFTSPSGTLDKFFVVAEIVFLIAAAGRVWGLDGALGPRLAGVPVLAWLAGAGRAGASPREHAGAGLPR